MTNQYHATPYDISATGFYFENFEDYYKKAATHKNHYCEPVEEYEMQFIDGENSRLFKALNVNQANLETWFDEFEDIGQDDAIKAICLAEHFGETVENILNRLEDISLFEGTALEYTEEYIEDTGLLNEIPENLRYYFDTEAFARDMVLGGDITEININRRDYIIWGF